MSYRAGRPAAFLAMVMLALPAAAEETPAKAQGIYEAAYFAPFAPQTAYDIATRTPGFALVVGDEVRGFAGASGNVLIDGARPSSKSGGVEDVLRRIPASQVERVEVIRDAQTSEAQGQSVVLNIVRRRGVDGGAWSAELERNGSGLLYPRGQVSYARKLGGWDASVKANGFWEQFPYRTLRLIRDGSGRLTSSFVDDRPTTLTEAFLSGDASRSAGDGVLKVTARFGWQKFYYDLHSDIFLARTPAGRPDQDNLFDFEREIWNAELGGDYVREIGPWTWKVVGLATLEPYQQDQTDTRSAADGRTLSQSTVRLRQLPLEALARTTFVRAAKGRFKPEFGVETAYNRLDSELSLVVDSGSGPRAIALPAADVLVQEWRGEAFANLTWEVSRRLTLEGALALEASRTTVTGDARNNQSFAFLKPGGAVVFRMTPRTQARVGLRRSVGQLNFSDFAASAELQDDETVAGNPALRPDRTTRLSASVDHRVEGGFAISIEGYREWRKDVLEQVLLPSGAPGLGNAGSATATGIKGSLNAPLDRILPGANLTVDAEVRRSRFADPLIGAARELNDLRSPTVTAEFRHNLVRAPWRGFDI